MQQLGGVASRGSHKIPDGWAYGPPILGQTDGLAMYEMSSKQIGTELAQDGEELLRHFFPLVILRHLVRLK